MNLKYITRQNSLPHGKPKVFFCCHPDDFSLYFPEISKDILDKQDCAIWFSENADFSPSEDYLQDLSQMQLFVFPVTLKLLCTENFAMDTAFPYALKQHIPVLPLIQEAGLQDIYSEKFGSLQFLDKHIQDCTALTYGEKLDRYLESTLIGSDLAAKIRAAFDAYIFLSYRKKDRKYALELMRLIHKNPLCQDIGIWFDEYLIPGENFNDVIKSALNKSDLFLLTVTPNLINEPNYIMETEYPLAKVGGKPILPAELLPTDHHELSEKYRGIPTCVNAYNDDELSGALMASIKALAIRENDASAEHKFFIGLAYLGGVDVEVNYEKAFTLIHDAAEAGLIEAMKKLAEMYHDGNGITQDLANAISWLRKIAARYEHIYKAEPTQKAADDYISALSKLAIYEFDGDKESFLATTAFIIDMLSIVSKEYSEDIRRSLAVCYSNLGHYYLTRLPLWRFDLAEENFLAAAALYEQLSEEQQVYYPKLASTYQDLGKAYYWLNKFDQAKEVYRKSLNILSDISSITSHEYDLQMSNIYCELAALYRRNEVYDQAELTYKYSIHILEKLEHINYQNVDKTLRYVLHEISKLYILLNRPTDAEKYLLKALDLAENIVSKESQEYANRPFNAILKKRLDQDARNIDDIIRSLRELYHNESVAKEADIEQRAVQFFARMAQAIPTIYSSRLGSHEHELAELFQTADNFEEAEQLYIQAISAFESCVSYDRAYHFSVAESCNNLAVLYHDHEQYDKAESMYRRALVTRQYCAKELCGKYANTALARSYINIGSLFHDLNRHNEAEEMYLKAKELCASFEDPYWLAKVHVYLGDLYRAMKRSTESELQFRTAIKICTQKMEADPKGFVPTLADAHDGLSFLYKKEGKVDQMLTESTAAKDVAQRYPDNPTCKRILHKP